MNNTAISLQIVTNKIAKRFVERVAIEPNKAIKDPEKQEKWLEGKRAKLQETAKLYPLCGQIACISIYNDLKAEVKTFIDTDEKALLTEFFTFIYEDGDQLIVKNKYFWQPYLIKRAIFNKIGIPKQLKYLKDVKELFGEYGMSAYSNQSELTNDMNLVEIDFREPEYEQIESLWNMYALHNEETAKQQIKQLNEGFCKNLQTLIVRADKPFRPNVTTTTEDIPF